VNVPPAVKKPSKRKPLLRQLPACYDSVVVAEALKAMLNGSRVTITATATGTTMTGHVWELYRSITTDSMRVRFATDDGRVYHFNSRDVSIARHA
jgi:hypothetical protein